MKQKSRVRRLPNRRKVVPLRPLSEYFPRDPAGRSRDFCSGQSGCCRHPDRRRECLQVHVKKVFVISLSACTFTHMELNIFQSAVCLTKVSYLPFFLLLFVHVHKKTTVQKSFSITLSLIFNISRLCSILNSASRHGEWGLLCFVSLYPHTQIQKLEVFGRKLIRRAKSIQVSTYKGNERRVFYLSTPSTSPMRMTRSSFLRPRAR